MVKIRISDNSRGGDSIKRIDECRFAYGYAYKTRPAADTAGLFRDKLRQNNEQKNFNRNSIASYDIT